MSSLYRRENSPYFWWTARHKGRRLRKSTKMTQKHLARKVQQHWDMKLVLDDLSFLGFSFLSPMGISDYSKQYLEFVEKRKSDSAWHAAKGTIKRFQEYLKAIGVNRLDELTVKVLDGYIDWLKCSPKTKKNHIIIISAMLEQAVKEGVIKNNHAKDVTLPKIVKRVRHRPLEPIDLEIIFAGAGSWSLFYQLLYHTGLRAGDVALLTYGNIDRKKKAIVSFVRKSRRIHEFPLAQILIDKIPKGISDEALIFPSLCTERDGKLKPYLTKARRYLQALLKTNGRPKATLHSFRVTFNNALRDLGLSIEDRQILLAHASSETTKIYTHPNFDLASQFVNRIPEYSVKYANVTKM